MNLRDIGCPTLDLTRLSKLIRNFSQRIRAKVADSGRSAKVSYRALSLEAMRLVVQFLKWPAEAFPRGRHPWPC